ncbi:MAG TPA: hypothetical protein VHA53_10855, partial [Nitrolancea sp.]|nr:hypothetical protein [Nitrolancea sp.]
MSEPFGVRVTIDHCGASMGECALSRRPTMNGLGSVRLPRQRGAGHDMDIAVESVYDQRAEVSHAVLAPVLSSDLG